MSDVTIDVVPPRKRQPFGQIITAESPAEPEKTDQERLDDFLRLALERFKRAVEAEDRQRRDALDDLEFSTGKQWPAEVSGARLADGRPCLTMNRLPQFIRQITNEQRQQRPAIQVNPVGSGSDVDTAEVMQGVIRHIELQSDAEIAYDTAFDHMVRGGQGYWRLILDTLPRTDELEIFIKRIRNPFTVYFDPSAIEPDYSDARWCFIVQDMSREEYRAAYPDSDAAKLNDFQSIGDQCPFYISKDTIRIADYFHVEEENKTIYELADGSEVDAEEYREMPPDKPEVVSSRKTLDRKVIWDKINAVEILESPEWPGYWIPVIPVLGDDLDVNGVRHIAGAVRHAKDPQRMYNYWVSAATESIALAPKAPFIGAEGQFEGHEGQWAAANQRNFPYLEYKPTDVRGQAVPPPQRQVYEPPIQAMSHMILQADNDLKATIGIYDASLGEKGPEQSGKAILARQKQGDLATLNFSDNLARSIRHTGRLLIDLIPHVYDAPRVQRIIKPDDTVSHVGLFNSQSTGAEDAKTQLRDAIESKQITKLYDIGTGHYDVTVSVGPSYQSKRQESVLSALELTKAYPPLMQYAGDLIVRNFDWPGAREIADRLKKTMPPNLIDDDGTDPKTQVIKLTAQLQQQGQVMEALTQHVNQLSDTIKSKQVENQGRMDIERMKIDAQVAIAEITAKAQNESERLKWEHDIFLELHGSAHDAAIDSVQRQHEAQMNTMQRQHEAQQSDLDRKSQADIAKQSATLKAKAQKKPKNESK